MSIRRSGSAKSRLNFHSMQIRPSHGSDKSTGGVNHATAIDNTLKMRLIHACFRCGERSARPLRDARKVIARSGDDGHTR
jgi:hypothetical protein